MPKVVDHEVYRHELLEGAFEVFAQRGFAVTMRGIAEALGVSTGTLYHYFQTKDDIYQQMLVQVSTETLREAIAQIRSVSDRAARMSVLLRHIGQRELRFRYLLLSVMDVVRAPDLAASADLIRDVVHSFRAALVEQLELTDAQGDLLFDLLLGALLHRALDPDSASIEAQLSAGARVLGV